MEGRFSGRRGDARDDEAGAGAGADADDGDEPDGRDATGRDGPALLDAGRDGAGRALVALPRVAVPDAR